jgi:putative ABC transport system ATP-binding protein
MLPFVSMTKIFNSISPTLMQATPHSAPAMSPSPTPSVAPVIQLRNIEKVYQTKTIETVALSQVNLSIARGEFVSVMGPSGCGKSTLLSLMGLLDEPSNGTIEIDGRPVTSYSDKELAGLRNHKIGFVFQSYHLINDLSVLDNVELPLLYRKGVGSTERSLMR